MNCRHCGHAVHCAHCHAKVDAPSARWAKAKRRQGRCARCGRKKARVDFRFAHCFECRRANSERMRKHYRKYGRKDRQRRAA